MLRMTLLLFTMTLAACGPARDTEGPHDGGTPGDETADCTAVCTNLAEICSPDPRCASLCESAFPQLTRACIARASTCAEAQSCGGAGPDGGASEPDASHSRDAGAAAADAGPPSRTCTLARRSTSASCDEGCTTFVKVNGGWFCSRGCSTVDDCGGAGSGFVCWTDDCVPTCEDDGDCTAFGYDYCAPEIVDPRTGGRPTHCRME